MSNTIVQIIEYPSNSSEVEIVEGSSQPIEFADTTSSSIEVVEPVNAIIKIGVGDIADGNKGDITVSGGGVNWALNTQQLASKFVWGVAPLGLINGSNAIFTAANQFIPESLTVEVNGLRQKLVNDYTVSGGQTITFLVSPQVGDSILVNYLKV